MEQEPRTLWDYGTKRTRQPLPWVPAPEIQAPLTSFLPHSMAPKRKESQKGFSSPTPCLVSQYSSDAQGASGFSCPLSRLRKGTETLLPQSRAPTHPHLVEGDPRLCPSLQQHPGPPAQHLVANSPLMSTLVLRGSEPRILRKPLVILMSRLAALLEILFFLQRSDFVPSVAPVDLLCPSHPDVTCSSGLSLAAPIPCFLGAWLQALT